MRRLATGVATAVLSLVAVAYPVVTIRGQEQTLEVRNWKGKHVGTARYVVMDSSTGIVFFIVVHLDQEWEKEIAIPVPAFSSYDQENGILILNASGEQLASAPEFHAADLDNPAFPEEIYELFDLVPSRTEENKEEGLGM